MSSSTFSTYMSISSNLARYQTMTADDPTVAQATKYFQANIGSITTPAQLVNNSPHLQLRDERLRPGRHDLRQEPDPEGAGAGDVEFHGAGQYAEQSEASWRSPRRSTSSKTEHRQPSRPRRPRAWSPIMSCRRWRPMRGRPIPACSSRSISSRTPRKSPMATASWPNSSLLTVVQTTLGISSYTSEENIDQQAKQLDNMLDYSNFQKPDLCAEFPRTFFSAIRSDQCEFVEQFVIEHR